MADPRLGLRANAAQFSLLVAVNALVGLEPAAAVAVGLSIVIAVYRAAIVIAAIVLLAAVLGFVQEYRAERALEALGRMAAPTATVVRDGRETDVPARELVPGARLVLHAGDRVSADGRLVEAVNLQVEESALTGE